MTFLQKSLTIFHSAMYGGAVVATGLDYFCRELSHPHVGLEQSQGQARQQPRVLLVLLGHFGILAHHHDHRY